MAGLHDTRNVCAWIAWTLLLVGAVAVGASMGTRVLFASAAERSVQAFEEAQQRERAVSAADGGAEVGAGVDADVGAERAQSDQLPEGVLRIPALDVRVPVYTGTAKLTLSRGAGRIDWTPPLGPAGNVGIAAHRDGAFMALKAIAIGDAVFIDWRGGTLRYEVVDTQIVKPTDVHVLDATDEPRVTLVTCYPFDFVGAAPLRFIVNAVLADGEGSATRAVL